MLTIHWRYFLTHPRNILLAVLRMMGFLFQDKLYLKLMYCIRTSEWLDLGHPQSFGEKIQWLKLYDRRPEYTMMVDKYAVKAYVAGIIGCEHVIPTLGVWDRPEDIDFESLPQQFVLKTTHGGGGSGVVICKNPENFHKESAIWKLRQSFKQDIYRTLREWPYKNVRKRVIAEAYLTDGNGILVDYKIYCFNGEPKYCQVMKGRGEGMTVDFYDTEWRRMPFNGFGKHYAHADNDMPMPGNFLEMMEMASRLSEGIPFVRVDCYQAAERVYFGELTFFPASGFGHFEPRKWDGIMGDLIVLPSKK